MNASEMAQQIDQVRGVLFGMANSGNEFLSPISSIAIHHALAARGRKMSVSETMQQLLRLREVQDLPYGYWLPVSTRLVTIGDCALLVSGKPTSHVISDYGITPVGYGLGRMIFQEIAEALPIEPLAHWLSAPTSTRQWANEFIASAAWSDPIGSEELILFDHWSKSPSRRWIEAKSAEVPDGPAVGKQEFPSGQVDHYLLRYRGGHAESLSQISSGDEAHRLRIALQAHVGNPRTWSIRGADDDTAVLTSYYLTEDEMRLLDVVATVDRSEDGIVARLPIAAIDGIREVLSNLGLKEVVGAHG